MQESNHLNVATMTATKHKSPKHYAYLVNALKNAALLTLYTFAFILIFGILIAMFVFAYSTIILQVMFDALPIILTMVFLSSIVNSIRDAKKEP